MTPGAPTPAERVRRIAAMMADGEWYGYTSRVALAEEWGIAESSVRAHSAEAHRRLTEDPAQVEQDRLALAGYCARMRRAAEAERHEVSGLRDIVGAMRAAELEAKFRGIDLDRPPTAGSAGRPQIEIRVLGEPSVKTT